MKLLSVVSIAVIALALQGCSTFEGPKPLTAAQLKNMTPQQRQAAIAKYNKEKEQAAENKPTIDALESAAGAILNSPGLKKATTHKHCNQSNSKPVCHQNADGSETCTQQSSGNCTSVGF